MGRRKQKKRILYIDHYAGSPDMGMEFRPYYLSREWVKMGHRVTIIAGSYSHLRKKNPAVTQDFQSENIDGIEYVWLKTGYYEGNGAARALSMWRFVRKLYVNARMIAEKRKPDVVIASSTYPLDTYPAQKIAETAGAEYVHEVHDMWPATLYEVGGMSKKHPFVVLMQIAENSAYKHCDKCVSLLPLAKEYMVQHGLNPDKFINVQNGVIEEEWENPEEIPDKHKEFFAHHKDEFIVGYFGGHALSNSLQNLLNTADLYEKTYPGSDVIFVSAGDGIEKEKLISTAEEMGLENLYFLPPVSKKAVPSLVKHFDCSYMTGKTSPLYRFGLSLNKMFDSMMAGLPILCVYDTPSSVIEDFGCGFKCSPSSADQAVEAIHMIREMTPEERKEIGRKGKTAVLENYTYSRLARKFLSK